MFVQLTRDYLGRKAGVGYVAGGSDDLLVRLEPGTLRAWDFTDEFQELVAR